MFFISAFWVSPHLILLFFLILKFSPRNPRGQNATQVIWGLGYFFCISFWNSGQQRVYQQHITLLFFYKERTREGVWPIKVEEQRAVFLCVCSWCYLEFLQFCRNKQSKFWNPWSGRFLWCDLTCRIVVPLWWQRVHCMVCTIYFLCVLYRSIFNKLGNPSSFGMVIKRHVKGNTFMCLTYHNNVPSYLHIESRLRYGSFGITVAMEIALSCLCHIFWKPLLTFLDGDWQIW